MTAYEQEFSRVGEIDHALTEVQRQVDFLLNITPTNSNEAWLDFERSGFSTVPMLQSRPLGFEPDLIKRRLYDLEIEEVEDPGLAILLRQKRDELCRQVMLLEDRDSSRFLHGSLQVFGPVGDQLVDQALEILARVGTDGPEDSRVTATAFAERAEAELDHYRHTSPGFAARLEIRPALPIAPAASRPSSITKSERTSSRSRTAAPSLSSFSPLAFPVTRRPKRDLPSSRSSWLGAWTPRGSDYSRRGLSRSSASRTGAGSSTSSMSCIRSMLSRRELRGQ